MSFASDVRSEVAHTPIEESCCARSELTAALLFSGGIAWRGRDRYAVSLTSSDAAVVRRYFALIKRFMGFIGQIRTINGSALNRQTRYQLVVPEEQSSTLLQSLDLLQVDSLFGVRTLPAEETVRYSCCKKAFVRAAFMLCGTISHPDKGYHIEIVAPTEDLASFGAELIRSFGIEARATRRKSGFPIYLKRAEDISDLLTLMGAGKAMMAFENIRVKKEVGNRVNRQMNCDTSNINRVMNAAEAQIRDIRTIESELGLEKLPKGLREMAAVRVDHPETPLSELGEWMQPPLGKSGVSARLRRLTQIAERLRSGEEIRL